MTRSNSAPSPSAQPEEPARSRRSRRSRRSARGSALAGRIFLLIFWFLLIAHAAWIYVTTPDEGKLRVIEMELPSTVLATALLAAVWCRQAWARNLSIGLLLLRVMINMIYLPTFIEPMLADHVFLFRMVSGPVLDSLMIWTLSSSSHIRRLISPSPE